MPALDVRHPARRRPCWTLRPVLPRAGCHDLLSLPGAAPRARLGESGRAVSRHSTWPSASAIARSGSGSRSCAADPPPTRRRRPPNRIDRTPAPRPRPRRRASTVDERRARIHDDLRGLISAATCGSSRWSVRPYAHDASLYEIDPLGAVVPAHRTRTSSTLVRYASGERHPAARPRRRHGAGRRGRWGRAWSSTSAAISAGSSWRSAPSMRRGPGRRRPGRPQRPARAASGARSGPDPSVSEARTVGGMIGGRRRRGCAR